MLAVLIMHTNGHENKAQVGCPSVPHSPDPEQVLLRFEGAGHCSKGKIWSPKQAKVEVQRHNLDFCVDLEATLLLKASVWQLCSKGCSLWDVRLSALSAVSFTCRLEHRYFLNEAEGFKCT